MISNLKNLSTQVPILQFLLNSLTLKNVVGVLVFLCEILKRNAEDNDC